VLEEAKGDNETWAEIKADAKNREKEDSCGSPMFRCGMTGCYYYYVIPTILHGVTPQNTVLSNHGAACRSNTV
jgi:hypothetical protein